MFLIGVANLPSALYTPLVVLLAVYVALVLIAGRARGNEDTASAERFEHVRVRGAAGGARSTRSCS